MPLTHTPDGVSKQPGQVSLVHCGRLSKEKNPALSLGAVRELMDRGVDAHLTVLGHGPMQAALMREARHLPVTFHPYISDRGELAAVLGAADLAFAPGPVETFGLAALEALACGVPVVCPDTGALGEVVGSAGATAPSQPHAFAEAALKVLGRGDLRAAARAQAEQYSWDHSSEQMLRIHHQLG